MYFYFHTAPECLSIKQGDSPYSGKVNVSKEFKTQNGHTAWQLTFSFPNNVIMFSVRIEYLSCNKFLNYHLILRVFSFHWESFLFHCSLLQIFIKVKMFIEIKASALKISSKVKIDEDIEVPCKLLFFVTGCWYLVSGSDIVLSHIWQSSIPWWQYRCYLQQNKNTKTTGMQYKPYSSYWGHSFVSLLFKYSLLLEVKMGQITKFSLWLWTSFTSF